MEIGQTAFDPAGLMSVAAMRAMHRIMQTTHRLLGVDIRVALLPRANTSYVRALVSQAADAAATVATSLDGTLSAEEEYAAAMAPYGPLSLRGALSDFATDELFRMQPVRDASNRFMVFVSERERYIRLEATPRSLDGAAMKDLLVRLVRLLQSQRNQEHPMDAISTFVREYAVTQAVRRFVHWVQIVLGVAVAGIWLDNHVRQLLAARTLEKTAAHKMASDATCRICLSTAKEDIDAGDPNRQWQTYHCGHEFHVQCGDSWLARRNMCPLCRRPNPKGAPSTRLFTIINSVHKFLLLRFLLTVLSRWAALWLNNATPIGIETRY